MRAFHVLVGLPGFPLARIHVETVQTRNAGIVDPELVVHRPALRPDHRLLRVLVQALLRQRIGGELLGLAVELHRAGLEHVRQPQVALRIDLEVERALGKIFALHGDGELLILQRARIEAPEELLVEHREPDDAVRVDDRVVRHQRPSRQLVLGDHHARALAGDARQRLQRVRPGAGALVDGGEILRVALDVRAEVAHRVARDQAHLRTLDVAVVGVARHALHHLHEARGVVVRVGDALERVAADAAVKEFLLVAGARKALQPFRVGELRAQILRLAQPQLDRRRRTVGDVSSDRILQLVAAGADAQRIAARLEPLAGEAVAAVGTAHHADRDRRAGFAGADHHAFHRAFGGHHPPGELGMGRQCDVAT